ncbi:MAG: serine/threonine protein kinase [Gemmatimonadales bacterium]|nr:MAG: serine/threonine protein kinase [Gemmatimonadales bacterium]
MIHLPSDPDGRDPAGGLHPGLAAALLRWAEQPLEPGNEVGRYRIVRPLGRGGMGTVYLAHDPILDRSVALKFLPIGLDTVPAGVGSDGDAGADRLVAEARAASALDHPNIGTIYEVGRDARGRRFIAMASYDGGTLRDRLRDGPLPAADALRIGAQVAEGLAAAHGSGIIHRDVKPENLVFSRDGRVRIVDFGLAVPRSTGRSSGSTGGTIAYMSPEQLDGAPCDERSDLWSLGVVLFEMLAGRRPREAADREELREAILETPSPALPDPDAMPPAVSELVSSLLSPDPDGRPPSAAQCAHTLRGALSSGRRRWSRTERSAAWGTFAAVAVLLIVGGLFIGRELPRVTAADGWAIGALDDRARVVVADFEAADDLYELALAGREALMVDLQQSSVVTALSRTQVAEILGRMGLPADSRVTVPLALEVAQRAGAGAVLEGTVTRAGSRVSVTGRALDPQNGEEFFSVRASAASRRLLGTIERLSREMRYRLGESRETLAGNLPLPEVTTPSIEALRYYAEAERIMPTDGERALRLLESALERDSTFAMAHRLAGSLAHNRLSFSDAQHHLEQAWEHRHRLPERERLHLEGSRALNTDFDPLRAVEIFERILEQYPNDTRAANNLGVVRQSWLDDHQGAIEAYGLAMELEPDGGFALTNALSTAMVLGNLPLADSLAAHASRTGLHSFVSRWSAARAFAVGDLAESWERCDRLGTSTGPGTPQAGDLEVCGSMEIVSGRLEVGMTRLETAVDLHLAEGSHRNVAHAVQGLVMADLMRGDHESAARRLVALPELLPAEDFGEPDRFITRTNSGIQAHLMGRPDIAEALATRYPPYPEPDHWFGIGSDALVTAAAQVRTGDGLGALETLDSAFPAGVLPIGLRIWKELLGGMASELSGELERAERHYTAAANPGFFTFRFATKDRIHLLVSLESLLRVQELQGAASRAAETRQRLERLYPLDASPPTSNYPALVAALP